MRCVPLVGSLQPQYSATVPERLDFSNGSANGTIALDSSLCTTLTNSWQVSARKAGLPAVLPPMPGAPIFFGYAEIRGWCVPVFRWAFGVREFPNMKIGPKGQRGPKSETLIESASGASPNELRAKAILLLLAIYGLRSSEVAGLRLNDSTGAVRHQRATC